MASIKSPLRYPGGKSRALKFLAPRISEGFEEFREPFVGGGAIFLHLASSYQTIERLFISDINPELYIAYKTIQNQVDELIGMLSSIENQYLVLPLYPQMTLADVKRICKVINSGW